MSDMLLMMKDEVVMKINFDEAKYDVVNQSLSPFTLQNRLRTVLPFELVKSKYDDTQRQIAIRKNYDIILNFLANRVLPLSRDNAKKVYNIFGFSQLQDDLSKAKIAICCKAVSLQDNYWIKNDDDNTQWSDVNLRTNKLNEIVAQISLHGSSLSLTGALTTPELTGQGAYAKAWKRENGDLWLYKRGAKDSTESRIEVMVSNILDNCNVNHLDYKLGISNDSVEGDITCCKCKCMTTEDISILPAMDFHTYCNSNDKDFLQEVLKLDAESYYKMNIIDYLISNRDRHGLNWGFFYNCNTMTILGCHPLFDHNNSFDMALMQDDEAMSLVNPTITMKQAAEQAMHKVDFYFYRDFTRDDFITDRQFQSFMRRANQLGIKVKTKLDKIDLFN